MATQNVRKGAVALLMAVITAAGYLVGRDQPIPIWIDRFLLPGLAWLGLILIVIIALDWISKRLG